MVHPLGKFNLQGAAYSGVATQEPPTTQTPKQLQEHYENLCSTYHTTVFIAHNAGRHGQSLIDRAYAPIEAFVSKHPSFALPEHVIATTEESIIPPDEDDTCSIL